MMNQQPASYWPFKLSNMIGQWAVWLIKNNLSLIFTLFPSIGMLVGNAMCIEEASHGKKGWNIWYLVHANVFGGVGLIFLMKMAWCLFFPPQEIEIKKKKGYANRRQKSKFKTREIERV
jgi:hypothetical protein